MTAAASPYQDIRANMEQTRNPHGLDHYGNVVTYPGKWPSGCVSDRIAAVVTRSEESCFCGRGVVCPSIACARCPAGRWCDFARFLAAGVIDAGRTRQARSRRS